METGASFSFTRQTLLLYALLNWKIWPINMLIFRLPDAKYMQFPATPILFIRHGMMHLNA